MANKTRTKQAELSRNGRKRAAIYVRVSSEKQAGKVSPEAQEADCRVLAERQGYPVVAVYRDVEKYRVGSKLVEPSGTRADRPGLRAMLADARAGNFDVILAWREDRLYRSYRPMLDVLETLEACKNTTGLTIEWVKEYFDPNLAPVKAWAARMELDAKHDRIVMGIAGRLKCGKAWKSMTPYGYASVDGHYVIDEAEAKWVRKIWQWFGDGVTTSEIRRRLISGGAKQRGRGKSPWAISLLRKIVHHDYYTTGAFTVTLGGEQFTLAVPPIVDAETAARVRARIERWKAYPSGNLKTDALVAGVVYCAACNTKMSVITCRIGDHVYTYYRCNNYMRRNHVPGCARSVRLDRIDAEAWEKLWSKISVPGELEAAIEQRVIELQAQEFDASAECEKLQKQLDDLAMKRQEAIALYQDKTITKADLELRLTSLSFEQTEAERELRDKSLLVGNHAERLLAAAQAYREAVLGGAVDVTQEPETPEEAERVFQFKREMIEGLVKRVDVLADKTTKVTLDLIFPEASPDFADRVATALPVVTLE